jgi:hypothetical protein
MDDITIDRHPVAVQLDELRSQLNELAALPVFGIPDQQLPELVCAARAAVSQVQAVYLTLLAQADVCEVARKQPRHPSTQTWMANALHIRPATAKHERLLAEALRDRPVLAAGLAAGTVCTEQADAILDAIGEVPADFGPVCRDELEQALVEHGAHKSPRQLRLQGEQTRATLDRDRYDREKADELARRERHAQERRYLRLHEDGYGSVYGSFRLSTVEAAGLRAVLDVLAKPQPATESGRDPRTAEQRMADALVQMMKLVQVTGELPANGGDRPPVVVTIAYPWLLDQLRGHGLIRDTDTPISPGAARRLACDAGILPMVLGGDSQPLDVGRAQRFFTKAQRHAIATRDKHCVHPGCDRPARWCAYHHIRHWADGGSTDVTNGVLLCTFHHALYDRDEWAFVCDKTGPTHVIPPDFIDLYQTPIPIERE